MSDEVKSSIEFSVNLTCQKCVAKTESALIKAGVRTFEVDLDSQSVLVETSLPAAEVQQAIERDAGKKAVIVGVGKRNKAHMGAAVAAMGGALGAGVDGVRGVVRFVQLDEDTCVVDGTIDGLSPGGEHALAIHASGDLSGGCGSGSGDNDRLGGHFNPRGARHGSPVKSADERHVGDLGNVRADESGRATFRFSNDLVKVWDILGRSVVVAQGRDDLGEGGHPRSKIDGNCGPALSCGIIARSAGLFQNSKKKLCACDGVTIWDERNVPAAGDGRSRHTREEEQVGNDS